MAIKQADHDDDWFGDFKFVAPSANVSQETQDNGLDDEWGDFMDNFSQKQDSVGNQSLFQPFNGFAQTLNPSNPPESQQNFNHFTDFSDHSTKATESKLNHVEAENNTVSPRWEKPQGALPLSIFGEEEVESESNKPTSSDTPDPFPVTKSPSPVKNEVNFGSGLCLADIIVNLYSQAGLVKIENNSNSNCHDGGDNFDNGSEFKDAFFQNAGGDRESSSKVDLTSNLSGVRVETTGTAINQQFEVTDRQVENSEGTLHKSGLTNGGSDLGDIFLNSDWFSHKPAGLYNNFLHDTGGVATQNGSISVSFAQANQNVNGDGNGLNSKSGDGKIDDVDNFWDFKDAISQSGDVNLSLGKEEKKVSGILDADIKVLALDGEVQATNPLPSTSMAIHNGSVSVSSSQATQNVNENGVTSKSGGEKIDADDNFWDFRDALSESGCVNFSSANEEKRKVDGIPGDDAKLLAFNSDIQGNGKGHGDNQESLSLSFSTEKLDSDDSLGSKNVSFHKPENYVRNGSYGQGFGANVSLTDLIFSLYSQAGETPPANSMKEPTVDEITFAQVGVKSDLMNGEDDFDDNSWEFKDAYSETKPDDESSLIQAGVSFAKSEPIKAQVCVSSDLMNGEHDFSWEFKDASFETKTEVQRHAFSFSDIENRFLSESKLKDFVHFYSRLREESFSVTRHHLDHLKEEQKVAALSGNDVKAVALHEEVQAAYKKLHKEDMMSVQAYSEELSARNICVNELMNETVFQVLESEYDLSKRISLAESDLNSAIELFKHAVLILKVLSLGSAEEQCKYIITWSKMISACAQELKKGALIWKQAIQQTIHKKMLSQLKGQQYFLALAEIYRVVEVLRASTVLYRPWLLANLEDPSVMFALLEECMAVWSDSELDEALLSISEPVFGYDGTIMALLESIKSIHNLDVLALQNRFFSQKESICQLSGLSCEAVPDMKVVVWEGEHYFLTLANLWVNRISCDPPKTPHLYISYDDC